MSAKDVVLNIYPQAVSDGNLRKWGLDERIRLQNALLWRLSQVSFSLCSLSISGEWTRPPHSKLHMWLFGSMYKQLSRIKSYETMGKLIFLSSSTYAALLPRILPQLAFPVSFYLKTKV